MTEQNAGQNSETPLVSLWLVKAHLSAAIIAGIVSVIAGFFYSLQFLNAYPFPDVELLSPGRVRLVHTSLIAYGFIVNGFIGGMYYAVPRLSGRAVWSHAIGKVGFYLWNVTLILNTIGLLLGKCQAVEWGETPTGFRPGSFDLNFIPIDLLITVVAVVLLIQFYVPLYAARNKKNFYVTQWYLIVGLVWLALTYLMGNILPEWCLPGASGAAIVGLFIHDLVGLLVTPFGWGLMYFFVPIILKKPIWSHWLSIIGFWALAFFYPLNGVHHFLLSPIPDFVEFGAVISTIGVEIVVTTVVLNFFMTMVGRGDALRKNIPIRWFYVGMVFYFLTCLQCAWHTTFTAQAIIHFTDWVVGHAHLVMFGVFGHWVIGITVHLWPRVTGKEWWSRSLLAWHFWLSTFGILSMFFILMVTGLIMGYQQRNLADWSDIVTSAHAFWILRTGAGIAIIAGLIIMAINMYMTDRFGLPYDEKVDELVPAEEVLAMAQAS
jgi:cytochrome c oxidase cbb3-type subunit 1